MGSGGPQWVWGPQWGLGFHSGVWGGSAKRGEGLGALRESRVLGALGGVRGYSFFK